MGEGDDNCQVLCQEKRGEMPLELLDINLSDCCGNGCANCILNTSPCQLANVLSKRKEGRNALFIYRKYKLDKRASILPNILHLTFKLPKNEANLILDIPPGHHVMMRAPDILIAEASGKCDSTNSAKKIIRPYSPFNVDCEDLCMEFLVNLAPRGKMSQYISGIDVGDLVEFRGPVGSFYHKPNAYEHLLIFTNGVAIAPVLRIIDTILNNAEDMTRVHLSCCFSNLDSVLFRERLHRYREYWNFTGNIYLSREVCRECRSDVMESACQHFKRKLKYKEKIFPCRLEQKVISNIFNNLDKHSHAVVICGSKKFEDFVKDAIPTAKSIWENIFVL